MERRISATGDYRPGYLDNSDSAKPCVAAGTSQQVAGASSPLQTTHGDGALTPASPISMNARGQPVSRIQSSGSEGFLAALIPAEPVSCNPNSLQHDYNDPRASLGAEHCAPSSSDSSEENSDNGSDGVDCEWWELGDSDQDDSPIKEGNNEIGDAIADTSERPVNTGHKSHRYSSSASGVHVSSHVRLALGVSKRHSEAKIQRRHRRKRYVESLRRSNVDLQDENSRLKEFLAHLERRASSSSG